MYSYNIQKSLDTACNLAVKITSLQQQHSFNGHFPRQPGKPVRECYHSGSYCSTNDGGGGDNWSYKTCKAPFNLSPPTNQHPAGGHSCRPTNSIRARKGQRLQQYVYNSQSAYFVAVYLLYISYRCGITIFQQYMLKLNVKIKTKYPSFKPTPRPRLRSLRLRLRPRL